MCNELKPTFKNVVAIPIGHARDHTLLTSHDWVVESKKAKTAWHQAHVRAAIDQPTEIGYWNLYVVESSDYEIRLRFWP